MMRTKKQRGNGNPYRGAYVWPEDTVSFSLPAGCTHADEVREIARQLHLEVASLPEELSRTKFSHGKAVFQSGYIRLMEIAANYEGWEFETNGKELRTVKHGSNLSPFDEFVGSLMLGAKRTPKGHLARGEYERITAEIDRRDFKPADHLERRDRELLRKWNRAHSRDAIQTFSEALRHKRLTVPTDDGRQNLLPRNALLVRLRRTLDKYREAHIPN